MKKLMFTVLAVAVAAGSAACIVNGTPAHAVTAVRAADADKEAQKQLKDRWYPSSGVTHNFLYQVENTDNHRKIAVVFKKFDPRKGDLVYWRLVLDPRTVTTIGNYRQQGEASIHTARFID